MKAILAAIVVGLSAIGGAAEARGSHSGSYHSYSHSSSYYTNVSGHRGPSPYVCLSRASRRERTVWRWLL